MKAIVCNKYGPPEVLEIKEVEKPVPKDDEVLIKIFATAVNSADSRIRSFNSPPMLWLPMRIVLGITKPRRPILGVVLSGRIVDVGKKVRSFKKGDDVFAMTGMKCGAYAQYLCLPEKGAIALKPKNATYEEAAALPFGGTTAMHFLRKAKIANGQRVLVYGASGAVGTSAVQIAKHFGGNVTGVCSGKNVDFIKTLGVDDIIDYTNTDFVEGGQQYDIIFDAVGKRSKASCQKALAPKGIYVSVEGSGVAQELKSDLILLASLFEKGELKAVIEKSYIMEEIVEAHRYVDTGRKRGNVIITIDHNEIE